MPITMNLSGIAAGDSLQISVSQSGLTAGPYGVGSWGGGGNAGTITVKAIHRSMRQMAPDSIRFEVDLSSSNFDSAGPTGDEIYDARLHDLIYLWDLGDPGTWDEPVNVLKAWKNRNIAKGPSIRHLYREPGDYTVSVLVIEPNTGKSATAELVVSVGDPQDFYGDANTIYVNNVGDDDFSYVPAGVPEANRINVDSLRKVQDGGSFTADTTWSSFAGGHAKRWRFKRGGSWEVSVYLNFSDTPDVMFDDYGDPREAKPIWSIFADPEDNELSMIRVGYSHDSQGNRTPQESPPEFRFRNIHAKGHFDSTSTWATDPASERSVFLRFVSSFDIAMADCKMDGFGGSVISLQAGVGSDYTPTGKIHLDNCALTNFGGQYQVAVFNTATDESSVAFTGVRWEQPGDAVATAGGYTGSRSPARIGSSRFIHIRGCDVFIIESDLNSFQIAKGPQDDGCLVNIHSCSAEGGSGFLDTDGLWHKTPQNRSHVHNMIVDGIIYVGTWSSRNLMSIRSTGTTVRNCLYICPAVPKISNGCRSLVHIESENGTVDPLPNFVADAPIKAYNNTFRVDRTSEQNAPLGLVIPGILSGDYGDFTAASEANNIVHMPNLIIEGNPDLPETTFAPLSENVLWTPRCLGRRDPSTLELDTQYATPKEAVKNTKPLAGSAALGAALTGDVSYMDITLQKRPEPPSMGAWEAD